LAGGDGLLDARNRLSFAHCQQSHSLRAVQARSHSLQVIRDSSHNALKQRRKILRHRLGGL